MNIAAG